MFCRGDQIVSMGVLFYLYVRIVFAVDRYRYNKREVCAHQFDACVCVCV